MAWWNLPIRSNRAWASGTAFWYDRPGDPISATARFTAEELDTSLIDAMCASSVKSDRSNVSTWARLIGDPVGAPIATGARNDIDTQFDWRPATFFGMGHCVTHLPTGGIYATDGSGWIIWTSQSIPTTEATSLASSPIWAAISAGNHDAKYIKFGERVVTKMASVNHPLKRLIIDFNHEMNQSNDFQIWAGNRAAYKAAMERTITMVRQGADNITPGAGAILRFMHRPGYRVDQGDTKVGPYNSFIPNNVDVLALSIHPDGSCNSDAAVDALFAGTLNSQWYGTDELIAHSIFTGLPIAFPEWSPQYQTLSANGGACPAANKFVTKFYNQVLQPNQGRLVCECIWNQNVRDKTGYTDTDAAGVAEWSAMVDTRKALWNGTQSDDTIPTSDSFQYTVEDEWGSRSANVAVTIEGGTVLFVTASPDAAETSAGIPVVIPVLDNDNASPSLFPLVVEPGSVTPPFPSGATFITTDNKIRYTPASGVSGIEATFNYTAKPSTAPTPKSSSIVRVQILSTTPPVTGDFPPLGGNQRFDVTSAGSFGSVYGSATAGDHVVVASGVVLSSPNLNRPGVVVRAAANQACRITGTLTMSASNNWIYGFRAVRFVINAGVNNLTFRRMEFNGNPGTTPGHSAYLSDNIPRTLDSKWEYCTFSNSAGGIRFGNDCRRGIMRFCHTFNITGTLNATEALIILEGIKQTYTNANFLIENCLYENCNVASGSQENETFSIKGSNNVFRRIQFDRCRDLNLRFGNSSEVLGCLVPSNSGNISARGRDHIFNNCSGEIALDDGNYDCDQGDINNPPTGSGSGGDFPCARDCTIIGGPPGDLIKIGSEGRAFGVTGTRIEGRGSSPNYTLGQGTRPTIIPTTSATLVALPNFPLGKATANTQVGVWGGL